MIAPTETLSRFVIYNRWIRKSNNTVKYVAFTPNDNGDTSVFRISDITDNEIWAIGDREVAPKRSRPILGRADIVAASVTAKDLKVIPNEPPERHANIFGWPNEKSEQKQIALELAEEAQFHKKQQL